MFCPPEHDNLFLAVEEKKYVLRGEKKGTKACLGSSYKIVHPRVIKTRRFSVSLNFKTVLNL